MDLIAQVVGAVLAFLVSVVGNIFAHDICASADSACAKIIRAAANRLAAFDRDSTEQEWLADLHDHQAVYEKYRHAVGCFLAAPKMRRCALEAPFVAEAPGLVWKERRKDGKRFWSARWASSSRAREAGYKINSVMLWSGCKTALTASDKEFFLEVTHELQAEQDRWLDDPVYRMHLEEKAAKHRQQFEQLMATGLTRDEACDVLYGPIRVAKEGPLE